VFGWLRRKNDEATRGEDQVWQSDAARVTGIRREVERAAKSGNVVVVAPKMVAFDQIAEALAPLEPRLCRDQFERTALHQALEGKGVVAVATPSGLPNQVKPGSNARAELLVVGRNDARSADDAIVQAADLLGARSSITFHLSFEDPLLHQHVAKFQPLFAKLGITADEPLSSPIMSRAIANMQPK
jgi:hypothetical protein